MSGMRSGSCWCLHQWAEQGPSSGVGCSRALPLQCPGLGRTGHSSSMWSFSRTSLKSLWLLETSARSHSHFISTWPQKPGWDPASSPAGLVLCRPPSFLWPSVLPGLSPRLPPVSRRRLDFLQEPAAGAQARQLCSALCSPVRGWSGARVESCPHVPRGPLLMAQAFLLWGALSDFGNGRNTRASLVFLN